MRRLLAYITSLFALLVITAHANTEKVIFIAPATDELPAILANLRLAHLSASSPSIRKSLPVAFAAVEQPYGTEAWYPVTGLKEGQRHEIRVCWAAIQPTRFDLDVFDINDLLQNSTLSQGIVRSSEQHGEAYRPLAKDAAGSTLFLRVHSAADFFTTNQSLMRNPPPVLVDIILDPYIFNIFPRSLLPTAAYIICLAFGSWYISGISWLALKSSIRDIQKPHND